VGYDKLLFHALYVPTTSPLDFILLHGRLVRNQWAEKGRFGRKILLRTWNRQTASRWWQQDIEGKLVPKASEKTTPSQAYSQPRFLVMRVHCIAIRVGIGAEIFNKPRL